MSDDRAVLLPSGHAPADTVDIHVQSSVSSVPATESHVRGMTPVDRSQLHRVTIPARIVRRGRPKGTGKSLNAQFENKRATTQR